MNPKSGRSSYSLAGVIGGAVGIAAGGFVHSTLPPGNVWLRAAETGASVAVVGGLVALAVVYFTSRRSK